MKRLRLSSCCLLAATSLAAAALGCASDDDATSTADAADLAGEPDAAPNAFDAAPTTDAPASQPDSAALPPDAALPDAGVWPPDEPWHDGKTCTLPACDPDAPETTDLSGSWSQTLTTVSTDCNGLVVAMDPRLQTGHVETVTGMSLPRSGECVYKDEVGGAVFGVIKGDVLITCEALPAENGVTPLVESEAAFTGDSGEGTAWTYLFDLPLEPSSCQAEFTQTFARE